MRSFIIGLLLFLPYSLNTQAAPQLPEDFYSAQPKMQLYMAYAEFKMAHYDTAHAMWQLIHKKGNGEAAFNLGILYEQGMGVVQSLQQAKTYYLSAAEKGSRAGAYQVGLMHMNYPDLVARDVAEHWLTIAALDGDSDAAELLQAIQSGENPSDDPMLGIRQLIAKGLVEEALQKLIELSNTQPPNLEAVTRLAWLYEAGLGVEQDIEQAGKLFKLAAEAGNAEAQYSVSVMYETGVGQIQDRSQSQYWLEQSAKQDYQPAVDKLTALK